MSVEEKIKDHFEKADMSDKINCGYGKLLEIAVDADSQNTKLRLRLSKFMQSAKINSSKIGLLENQNAELKNIIYEKFPKVD